MGGGLDVAASSAYEVAQQGGRQAGLLRTYQGKSVQEIQRALRIDERQAALHRQKMSSPETFVQDWVRKSPRAQQGLLRHWQQDLNSQPRIGRCHTGDTATKGYTVMKDDDTLKNYLFDLGGLIKEYALAAVAEREKQRDRAAQEFYDGYVQGFHRVVSLMQQQAQAFGIDLKDLQLEGVEPDRDLV
jgi:hypothetical protein